MSGIVIIGTGPGIGASIARRFARENLPVALIARQQATLEPIEAELSGSAASVMTVTADAAKEAQLGEALSQVVEKHGVPDVLVYNAAIIRLDQPGELSRQELLRTWETNVLGGLQAGAAVGPEMAKRGSGSIFFTGGMPNPNPALTSLSLGKAGLRGLADLLAAELGPAGVHVATVTVSGGPVAPGGKWDPDEIAEHFWQLHLQSAPDWDREIVH
ncbi:SDR family NAD(P)-dependent oxidoreductase [Arthrobacter bambusae]